MHRDELPFTGAKEQGGALDEIVETTPRRAGRPKGVVATREIHSGFAQSFCITADDTYLGNQGKASWLAFPHRQAPPDFLCPDIGIPQLCQQHDHLCCVARLGKAD